MERLVGFQGFKEGNEFIQHLVVQIVTHITALFFGKNDLRIGQQFQVVGNGGLREINQVAEVYAIQTVILFFYLLQDQETI